MKKLAFVVAALALALPAAAQEKQTRLGLGVAITPNDFFQGEAQTVSLYMPIDIGAGLRVEPSLGIFSNNPGGDGGTDTSNLTLGAGVFGVKRVAEPLNLYFGGRVKLNFASWDDGTNDDSGVDLSVAGALGGEYFLVPKFSLGLEGNLGFYSNSEANLTNVGDSSGFFTDGLAFLRMYF
jgi:hypothetical protein